MKTTTAEHNIRNNKLINRKPFLLPTLTYKIRLLVVVINECVHVMCAGVVGCEHNPIPKGILCRDDKTIS